MVIAFPGGRGKANMVKIAEIHAVPVMNIPENLSQDQVLPFVEQQLALIINQQIHQHDSEIEMILFFENHHQMLKDGLSSYFLVQNNRVSLFR